MTSIVHSALEMNLATLVAMYESVLSEPAGTNPTPEVCVVCYVPIPCECGYSVPMPLDIAIASLRITLGRSA